MKTHHLFPWPVESHILNLSSESPWTPPALILPSSFRQQILSLLFHSLLNLTPLLPSPASCCLSLYHSLALILGVQR